MAIFHRAEFFYEEIYIHNNVWTFCGDDTHTLIKFFFGCLTDVQKKKIQKEAMRTCFTES